MNGKRSGILKSICAGLITAILITLAGMLALAGILMLADVGDRAILLVNQLVKLTSVVLGTCVAVRRGGQRGLVTGVVISLLYACLGYAMYVALGGMAFSVGSMLGEILICTAAGAVTGTIRANLSPKRKKIRTAPQS